MAFCLPKRYTLLTTTIVFLVCFALLVFYSSGRKTSKINLCQDFLIDNNPTKCALVNHDFVSKQSGFSTHTFYIAGRYRGSKYNDKKKRTDILFATHLKNNSVFSTWFNFDLSPKTGGKFVVHKYSHKNVLDSCPREPKLLSPQGMNDFLGADREIVIGVQFLTVDNKTEFSVRKKTLFGPKSQFFRCHLVNKAYVNYLKKPSLLTYQRFFLTKTFLNCSPVIGELRIYEKD